jgi:hypothetical protein
MESMDNLDDWVRRLEQAQSDLQDAMIVHAYLEKASAERIKEHALFIAVNEQFIARHEQMMQEFDDKLNALISIVMKREGGLEGRA